MAVNQANVHSVLKEHKQKVKTKNGSSVEEF